MKKINFLVVVIFLLASVVGYSQKYGKTPEDSLACLKNISLYKEDYKNWQASGYKNDLVTKCIGPWRSVLLNCPKSTQYIYVDGLKIMDYMYNKTADVQKKEKYADTIMMIYDMRIEHFGAKGANLGKKAVDMMQYRPKALEQIYSTFVEAVNLTGDNTSAIVLVYYVQSAINMVKANKADESAIFEAYEKAMAIAEPKMQDVKDSASYNPAVRNMENLIEPYAKCENLVPSYAKKYDANANNVVFLRKMTDLLDSKGCTSSPVFLKAVKKLYEMEPSASSAAKIAKIEVINGNYKSATEMYLNAIGDEKESAKKVKYYMELADLSFRKMGSNSSAISYAKKALSIDPSAGEAYILIGDVIASTRGCGENAFENKTVYWLAVDYYSKAKSVDASKAAEANKRISTYSQYFPNKEDAFFYGVTEGASVNVPCYGESTRARF